ncbi:MAG: DUF6106 family protein [Lachnospira sp.]|nr:DUF6106 family protein [Lachnospira sp.]
MDNLPVEYLIKAKAPKSALPFKIIMILACILAAITVPTMMMFGFMLTILLIVFTVFLFRHYNFEYEYSLMEGELTIDRITSQSTRKRCGVYDISKATLIAKPDSQDALRLSYQKLRNADYTSNMEENKDQAVVIYTYDESNELVRIFIEPNEAMLDAIKKSVPKTAYKVEENA